MQRIRCIFYALYIMLIAERDTEKYKPTLDTVSIILQKRNRH